MQSIFLKSSIKCFTLPFHIMPCKAGEYFTHNRTRQTQPATLRAGAALAAAVVTAGLLPLRVLLFVWRV